jgi:(2Fe-2S) ferredoxin
MLGWSLWPKSLPATAEEVTTIARFNMAAFTHHIFVCGNVREQGHKRGCCDPDGRQALRDAFKRELKTAGLGLLVRANHAGCLDQCEHGPTVVIYPSGIWYGHVTIEDVPRIVAKTVLRGEVISDLVIPDDCLNNPDCPHRGGSAGRSSRG